MKNRTSATVPAVGSFSRRSAHHWTSRWHLDRPFPKTARIDGPVHIADAIPAVLRNLTTGKGGGQ